MKMFLYLKYLWLGLVIYFAAKYFTHNQAQISELLNLFTLTKLILSFSLIILTKLLLTYNQSLAAPPNLSFIKNFYIYQTTQLSKYIPGVIWQYLGKAGEYLNQGANQNSVHHPVIREVFYLASGSLFSATIYLLFSYVPLHLSYFLILLCAGFIWSFFKRHTSLMPHLAFLHLSIWALWGLSLSCLIPGMYFSNLVLLYRTFSAAAFSFLAGYLVVFAPGGLGIRETVFAAILGSTFNQDLILIASFHRLLYFIVEIILFFIALSTRLRYKI